MIIDFEKVVHYHAEVDDKMFNNEFGTFVEGSLISYCENASEETDNCWINFDEIQNIYWKKDENDKVHIMNKSSYEKFVEERENAEHCYECSGYGDDYYIDSESGELVSNCTDCPFNMHEKPIEDKTNSKINVVEFIKQFKNKVKEFYSNIIDTENIDNFVNTLFKESELTYVSVDKNNRIFLYAENPSRFIQDNTMWNFLQNWVKENYDTFMAIGIFSTEIVHEYELYSFEI